MIRRIASNRNAAADRRHLKNVAVLLLPHHWQRGPCRILDAVEARIHDSLEIFRAHLLERRKLPISGVVLKLLIMSPHELNRNVPLD
jgi:hypothetical protein